MEFKKIKSVEKTKYGTLYLTSKTETIINESDVDDVFKSIYTTIITNIKKSLGKSSSWIIDSVIDHNINVSKYRPAAVRIYIKLPTKLDHLRKTLINIQNIDHNEYFKWCLGIYLHPAHHNLNMN